MIQFILSLFPSPTPLSAGRLSRVERGERLWPGGVFMASLWRVKVYSVPPSPSSAREEGNRECDKLDHTLTNTLT
jgi:hypothetical protein